MPINTDPQSLITVASKITQAAQQIEAALKSIDSALAGAQWNDPVRTRFEADYRTLKQGASRFVKEAPGVASHLKTKAGQLGSYTQR
ncbi:MAG: WXG100 family type VII secretion target [Clostridia bacterium]|nr:WXG100 family type VII secretion target [Clostridia bacterium]MBQ3078016.1 WXG100 family type VII secretion target [Clostridia bacterium]